MATDDEQEVAGQTEDETGEAGSVAVEDQPAAEEGNRSEDDPGMISYHNSNY